MEKLFAARLSKYGSPTITTVKLGINHDYLDLYENDPHSTFQIPLKDVKVAAHRAQNLSLSFERNGEHMMLEITDRALIHLFEVYTNRNTPKAHKGKMWMMVAGVAATIIMLVWLFFAVALPAFAAYLSSKIPIRYEQQIGLQLRDAMIQSEKVDRIATRYINQYFAVMHPESDYKADILVIKSNVVNAFALPGGYIVVHTALLDSITNHESLAALLAHEFGHVHLRHSTRNIFRTLSGYLIVSLITGDMGGIGAVILQQAEKLQSLGYSRKLEAEADQYALIELSKRGLSVQGAVELFELLKKQGNESPGEWLSTHPDLEKRIAMAKSFKPIQTNQPAHTDSLIVYFNKIKTRNHDW